LQEGNPPQSPFSRKLAQFFIDFIDQQAGFRVVAWTERQELFRFSRVGFGVERSGDLELK
jgi:hypothetical protein